MDIKIKKYLEKNNIKYTILEHRKVYTAYNSAETQHKKTGDVVKTILLKLSNREFVLAAIPAGKRLDLVKATKVINQHALKSYKSALKTNKAIKPPKTLTAKIATEKDILNVLHTQIGLICPISQIYGLSLLLDKKLLARPKLVISAGSYTESLEIKTKDFLKIHAGFLGIFTQ